MAKTKTVKRKSIKSKKVTLGKKLPKRASKATYGPHGASGLSGLF